MRDDFNLNCTIIAFESSHAATGIDRATATVTVKGRFEATLHSVIIPQRAKVIKSDGSPIYGSFYKGWPEADDTIKNLGLVQNQEVRIEFYNGNRAKGKYFQRQIIDDDLLEVQGVNEEIWIEFTRQG